MSSPNSDKGKQRSDDEDSLIRRHLARTFIPDLDLDSREEESLCREQLSINDSWHKCRLRKREKVPRIPLHFKRVHFRRSLNRRGSFPCLNGFPLSQPPPIHDAHASRRKSLDRPPQLSNALPLRIVLLGKSVSENSEVGNFILGRSVFDSEAPLDVVERVGGRLKDRRVILINSSQLLHTNISDHQITQIARECVSLSDPGPHVVLLLLQHEQCSAQDLDRVEKLLDYFSNSILQHSMVISTQEPTQTNDNLQRIIHKCSDRHFVLQRSTSPDDLLNFLEEIEHINEGQHLCCVQNVKHSAESEDELRIVLLGKTGVGKSATGNTILGRDAFKAEESIKTVTKVSQRETSEINSRQVTVIDTPGLFATEPSNEEIQREIRHCISMILPGPHVFLLLIPLGRFTKEEETSVEIIKEMFGKNVLEYTIVLFTRGDHLKSKTIDQCLGKTESPLMNLIKDCGNRYHVFNNNQTEDRTQVSDLLKKIDSMVKQNRKSFYSCRKFREMEIEKQEQQMKILIDRVKEKKEEIKKLEEEKDRMKTKIKEERKKQDQERKRREDEYLEREERYKLQMRQRKEMEKPNQEKEEPSI